MNYTKKIGDHGVLLTRDWWIASERLDDMVTSMSKAVLHESMVNIDWMLSTKVVLSEQL